MTTRRSSSASITDVLLGLLLIAAGALVIGGAVLQVIPSLAAFAAFVLAAGVVGILGALVGRTSPGFFSEIVSAALATVLGVVLLVRPAALAHVFLLAGALFAVNGIVRVAAATEYPSLRGVFLIGGAASLALAAAVFSDAVPATLQMAGVLVGIELVVDGLSALLIGRHEHPSRSSR